VPLNSMTGFSRAAGRDAQVAWTWEARSVNGKSLDIRCRVPAGFDALEQAARKAVADRFKRGNKSVSLNVERTGGAAHYTINRELLDRVLALRDELSGKVRDEAPSLEGLLAIRGMIEPDEAAESAAAVAARQAAVETSLAELIVALGSARAEEGARLETVVMAHLQEIAEQVESATRCAATQPAALRARLGDLVSQLLDAEPALSPERLAQEAALLVGKADIREELDRLRAHIEAAKDLMADGNAIGRRFDFLCQEFNREANTLCSKSADVELTRIGLALKASIEQLREQIQNVE
jgi:uncharacterized protein (TIGR00255 family)